MQPIDAQMQSVMSAKSSLRIYRLATSRRIVSTSPHFETSQPARDCKQKIASSPICVIDETVENVVRAGLDLFQTYLQEMQDQDMVSAIYSDLGSHHVGTRIFQGTVGS
jgi:hypothetical protein